MFSSEHISLQNALLIVYEYSTLLWIPLLRTGGTPHPQTLSSLSRSLTHSLPLTLSFVPFSSCDSHSLSVFLFLTLSLPPSRGPFVGPSLDPCISRCALVCTFLHLFLSSSACFSCLPKAPFPVYFLRTVTVAVVVVDVGVGVVSTSKSASAFARVTNTQVLKWSSEWWKAEHASATKNENTRVLKQSVKKIFVLKVAMSWKNAAHRCFKKAFDELDWMCF